MTLDVAEPGKYEVISVHGGRGLRARLADMGVYSGAEIEVINYGKVGPIRIISKGAVFGIGRGMAAKITVRKLE